MINALPHIGISLEPIPALAAVGGSRIYISGWLEEGGTPILPTTTTQALSETRGQAGKLPDYTPV
jgi:hypothetical protein